jgi:hypothetical protein
MDDLKGRLKQAEAELEKVKLQLAAASKQLHAALKQAQAVQEYAEAEHARVTAEPTSDRKAARVAFAELRLLSASASLEVAQLAASLDLLKPVPPATKKRIDDLSLYIQFIGFEMNLSRYQPVRQALGISLGVLEAPEAASPSRPGLPGRAGPAPRPGPPRPPAAGGTGPLPRPGVQPAARPLPPRPAPLPRPAGAPAAGLQQRTGTGSLRPPVGLPTRHGTRPLGKPSGIDPAALAEELKAHAAADEVRQKLRVLYDRIEEVEAAMAPLRGPSTGELSMPCEQASGALRQLAGKVYFIHRAIAALDEHGDLASKLAFEITDVDPKVQQILLSMSPEAATAPAPAAGEPDPGPLGARLRSIFKP